MKKQSSGKRGERSNTAATEKSKFLSLNRQTYKPYLKDEKEDEEASHTYDPDQIVKFAY